MSVVTSASLPGRIDVTARAIERAVIAIASRELGVPTGDVSVALSDEKGLLGVSLSAPLRLAPIADLAASGYRLLGSAQDARARIRSEIERATGRAVGSVTVRLTSAVVTNARRAR